VREAARALIAHVETTLRSLAASLRGGEFPERLPDLRAEHGRLVAEGAPHAGRYALADEETDRLANGVNTLAEILREWPSKGGIREPPR
jgi:hypothetical protein